MPTSRQRGFTLIELLIVVAILGIIAAVLIPNLLEALQKAKQKRTVADMRNVGTAWMAWLSDQVGAASAGAGKTYHSTGHLPVSHAQLLEYLRPSTDFFYMQEVPQHDGWSHPYGFAMGPDLSASTVLMICSPGLGGDYLYGPDCIDGDWSVAPFLVTDYSQDIVWADGYYVRWPE